MQHTSILALVLRMAVAEARHLNHTEVTPDHLWISLIRQGAILPFLERVGVDTEELSHEVLRCLKPARTTFIDLSTERRNPPPPQTIPFSASAERIMAEAEKVRELDDHVDILDLLMVLVSEHHSLARYHVWATTGRTIARADEVVTRINPGAIPVLMAA